MPRALLLIVIALGFPARGFPARAAPKLGFVDMQRAMLEVDDGKKAKAALEKMKKARQVQLDARQEELRTLQKNLEAQAAFMKEDVKRQKQAEFQKKLGELQMTYAQLQKELAQEEARRTKSIICRMSLILSDIGKRDDYLMIFEKTESSLLWAQRHLELTNDVIRRYNAGEAKDAPECGGKKKKKGKKKKGKK